MWEILLYVAIGGISLTHAYFFYKRTRHFEVWMIEPMVFAVSGQGGKNAVTVKTDKVWFNNASKKAVKNVRMKMSRRPSHYYFHPVIDFVETKTEDGTWLLVLPRIEANHCVELNIFNGSDDKLVYLRDKSPLHVNHVHFPQKQSPHRANFIKFTMGWLGFLLIISLLFAVPALANLLRLYFPI